MTESQQVPFHVVDSDEQFVDLCQYLSGVSHIAVDTEFVRTQTFYPQAGLIQLSDGEQTWLIDPLAVDLAPLLPLWQNPAVVKVLHAGSEDLELFQHYLGAMPRPIFDTQIGAALAGLGFSMGYGGLVEQVLGIRLEKGETRSDWLARPLSAQQLSYAADDVKHLLQLYRKIEQTLQQFDRFSWAQQECDDWLQQLSETHTADGSQAYLKIKSAWQLSPVELAVLQKLAHWREKEARQRNRPRNYIVKERALWSLARHRPNQKSALKRVEDLAPVTIRHYGDTLLNLIREAEALPEEQLPARLPKPLSPAAGEKIKQLKAVVRQRAEQEGIPPEILARKRDLEHLVRSSARGGKAELPLSLLGWRQPIIGQELLVALAAL